MKNPDRLYALVPAIYRLRDAAKGHPLQALLRVIAEQVEVVEDDIARLYENWFIETCDEWIVPYIGDLIGYQPIEGTGESSSAGTARGQRRERVLVPRRDVARTIHARRRKGTLAMLDEAARDVAGWPAVAVEFYRRLGWTQNVRDPRLHQPVHTAVRFGDTLATLAARHRLTTRELLWLNPGLDAKAALPVDTRLLVGWRPSRGRSVDLREVEALELSGGPFDRMAHTVDVRRTGSHRATGRYNIPSVGLFVWRLRTYSVGWTGGAAPFGTPAYCVEEEGPHCYTFSVLGNDTPLYNRPQPEVKPTQSAGELNLPTPIRRGRFAKHPGDYYGPEKSLAIRAPDWPKRGADKPIEAGAIIVADLSDWRYNAPKNQIVVDPESGRLIFPRNQLPSRGVSVYYQYAFSAAMGGGEYDRPISQAADAKIYRVGAGGDHETITDALERWSTDKTAWQTDPAKEQPNGAPVIYSGVIEIVDSGVYTEKLVLTLDANESLQIRAANRRRPVLRLLDYMSDKPDPFRISGARGSRFTLDGLLVTGRGLWVQGADADSERGDREQDTGDLCSVTIRHCTLVPGWGLHCDCHPRRPSDPSLELWNTRAHVRIEHSIVGAVELTTDTAATDPVCIHVADSLWDATEAGKPVLSGAGGEFAHARLTVVRSTVFGEIAAHEIALAENSIFTGQVCVARRQRGCVRFCYVPPGSRTPRRYECQPDLVVKAVEDKRARGEVSEEESAAEIASEQRRVEPDFNSTRYGRPTYGQLAGVCADEIATGADDESEMGAFHDLYQPQRAAGLRTRLNDFTPAGTDAGTINAT